MKEKAPVWYSDPQQVLRGMFPQISEAIAGKTFQLLGIQSLGQICILPLVIGEEVIGAMPIWGADLQPADSPVLAVFASQVAGILQNASAFESETRRANELARMNALILALSKVAARLDNTPDFVEVVKTFSNELKKIKWDCMVGTLDDSKQTMTIEYVSVRQEVIHWAERATGHSLRELVIPRHLWPTEKVVTEKTAYWDPNLMKGTLNMFPNPAREAPTDSNEDGRNKSE